MTSARAQSAAVVRRRPKDRKDQIARASAEAFSAQGYHAVSMEAIAAMVGISAPALYRHHASKYELFRGAVLALGQQLVDSTDFADTEAAETDPADTLNRLIEALVDVTLANRESGGLYRWQARYLHSEDQSTLGDQLRLVNRRIQRPLIAIRPTLTSSQRWMLSAGLLSVIGSAVDHRVQLPTDEMRALLAGAASAVLRLTCRYRRTPWTAPPPGRSSRPIPGYTKHCCRHRWCCSTPRAIPRPAWPRSLRPSAFRSRESTGTSPASATSSRRGYGVQPIGSSGRLSAILTGMTEPGHMLTMLIEAYVATSFANPDLAAIYYTERVNLTRVDQELLRSVQRSTIDAWMRLLAAARPALTETQARVLVHAAMALVVDVGRLVHYENSADNSAYSQACVRKLMEATVFGTGG